jgi:hypothetical protein
MSTPKLLYGVASHNTLEEGAQAGGVSKLETALL